MNTNNKEQNTLSQESLNLILRRVDWRFLLSDPNPKKSICFSKGALAEAVEFVSESIIYPDTNSVDNNCDLAVASDPDPHTIHLAWSALRPGGSCYIEWKVNKLMSANSIRKKLESIGFDQVELYIPKPPPTDSPYRKDRTRVWMPMEEPGVSNFYMNVLVKNPSRIGIRRLGHILQRLAMYIIPGLFTTYPWLQNPCLKNLTICSISTKPIQVSKDLDTYSNNTIKNKLFELSVINDIKKTSILMLTTDFTAFNKVILNVFMDGKEEPSFIVKLPRTQEMAEFLTKEAENLITLENKYEIKERVPKLLFQEEYLKLGCIGESFMSGTRVANAISINNFRDLAFQATEFLSTLGAKSKISAKNDHWSKLIKPILFEFNTFFETVLEPSVIQKTNKTLNNFELKYVVSQHGDFAPWNTLVDKSGQLKIIDWEDCIQEGLPAIDLISFIFKISTYLTDTSDTNKFLLCYREVLDESTYTGSVFKECLNHYCNEIGINYSTIAVYRLLSCLIELNFSYYEFFDFEHASPNAESIPKLKYTTLLEEELMQLSKI